MIPVFQNNQYCTHCNGFGSSLLDKGDTRCTQCDGTGLRADQVEKSTPQETVKCNRCNDSGSVLDWAAGGNRFSGLYSLSTRRCECMD